MSKKLIYENQIDLIKPFKNVKIEKNNNIIKITNLENNNNCGFFINQLFYLKDDCNYILDIYGLSTRTKSAYICILDQYNKNLIDKTYISSGNKCNKISVKFSSKCNTIVKIGILFEAYDYSMSFPKTSTCSSSMLSNLESLKRKNNNPDILFIEYINLYEIVNKKVVRSNINSKCTQKKKIFNNQLPPRIHLS